MLVYYINTGDICYAYANFVGPRLCRRYHQPSRISAALHGRGNRFLVCSPKIRKLFPHVCTPLGFFKKLLTSATMNCCDPHSFSQVFGGSFAEGITLHHESRSCRLNGPATRHTRACLLFYSIYVMPKENLKILHA